MPFFVVGFSTQYPSLPATAHLLWQSEPAGMADNGPKVLPPCGKMATEAARLSPAGTPFMLKLQVFSATLLERTFKIRWREP